MIPRALLLIVLLAACEKESSRTADPSPVPGAVAPAGPDRRPVDGVVTIELPVVKAGATEEDRPKIVVAIARDGSVFVGGRPAGSATTGVLDVLKKSIAELVRNGYDEVYLDVDEDLPYSAVIRVMAAAKEAGIVKIQLITGRDLAPPLRASPTTPVGP